MIIYLLLPEDVEGEDREKLEVGWSVVLRLSQTNRVINNPEVRGKFVLLDRRPIDTDPFCGRDQMRRGVEASFESVLPQDRLGEGAGGALALGPRHVDDLDLVQVLQGHPRPLQVPPRQRKVEVDVSLALLPDPRQHRGVGLERVQGSYSFVIGA